MPSDSQSSSSQKLRPIVHSRGSSTSSNTSGDSRSSAEYKYYASPTSRITMARGDISERTEKKRVPDNPKYYIPVTTSKSGKNVVNAHNARHNDPNEPRASEARDDDYKRTQDYTRSTRYYSSSSGSSSLR